MIDVASLSRRYGLAAAPSQRRDSGSSVGSSASGGCACTFLCFSLSFMPQLSWSLCSFKWGLRTLERMFVVVRLVHSNAILCVCLLSCSCWRGGGSAFVYPVSPGMHHGASFTGGGAGRPMMPAPNLLVVIVRHGKLSRKNLPNFPIGWGADATRAARLSLHVVARAVNTHP